MHTRHAAAVLAWALAALLTPAHAAGPEAADRLCPQTVPAPAPKAMAVTGCEAAWCTAIGQEQFCNCQRGERWFAQRRRGGQLLQQWAAEVSPMIGPDALQVTQADVDGDGKPEWLLSQFESQSNGLGVTSHRLCLLWADDTRRAPLCRDLSEWQQLTVLVREHGRKGCSLMDSNWQGGREKGRGPGTYAVGRLQRLQDRRWHPAPDRTAVSRRLLDSFMNERETLLQSNAQRLWYQHPDARTGQDLGR